MPGQRKRKRQRQTRGRDRGNEAGRWEVVFETQDQSEWRTRLRELRAADDPIDWESARIDTLCGRLTYPTTYRLSVFVPDTGPADPGLG
ncbi:hypothetical protein ABZ353_08325 [Streptomyces niveus]|uniref:Uncharacterized protein n=1 Tax=Streptomyces niveus TaxID=193462 RepID=A0A1U9QS56_STRNV|nr:hypothetical protein [Streptomyces niveus]AQU67020.1 hypothetical protein BBN63_13015 [Streptomyces niveus]